LAVDSVADVALEGAKGLLLGLAFGDLALEVDPPRTMQVVLYR
jgi:hypothetical protein